MHVSEGTLERAVRVGVISQRQKSELLALEARLVRETHEARLPVEHEEAEVISLPESPNGNDASIDENLRLVGGGNDLFVTVGIGLLAAGLFFALATFFSDAPLMLSGSLAVFSWLVAEFVTRQKRMRLSSTVLALLFVASASSAIGIAVRDAFGLGDITRPEQVFGLRPVIGEAGLVGFGSIIAVSLLYFWRFRVPILAAVIAVALTALAFLFTTLHFYDGLTTGQVALPTLAALPDVIARALYMPLACGIVIFLVGVGLDLRDRQRVTIWSDCAFWLHVISAPLLVHPLFVLATGQDVMVGAIEPSMQASLLLTALIVGFVLVALAIDRRSLLIPTLAYFGSVGIYYLINSTANSTGIPPFALILLVVGGLVLMFGAGWQRIRSLIIGSTLPTSVLDRLPPLRP